jgi:hypothetical protein
VLEGFDPLHFDDSARAREAFHHYGRFAATRLSLVVATCDGAGAFATAFDAPNSVSRRAAFARRCVASQQARRRATLLTCRGTVIKQLSQPANPQVRVGSNLLSNADDLCMVSPLASSAMSAVESAGLGTLGMPHLTKSPAL